MNPLFIATPSQESIAQALELWPELGGKRVRPLLVSAFGDIYVETEEGEVLVVAPLELEYAAIADSVTELERKFADQHWAEEWLMTELVLLAHERGVVRSDQEVFSVSPHPYFTGKIELQQLTPMSLHVWHHICMQLR